MPMAGSRLENVIVSGARRSHEMDRIGTLLSSMPAGRVVVKAPSPPQEDKDSNSSRPPKEGENGTTTRNNI